MGGRLLGSSTGRGSGNGLLRWPGRRDTRARRVRAVHPHVVVATVVVVTVSTVVASAIVVVVTVAAVSSLVMVSPVEVSSGVVVVVVPSSAAVAHSTAPGRRHAKRLAVQLALLTPVHTWLALAIRLRLARDVVEERLGLVVPVRRNTAQTLVVLLGLLLTSSSLVARVVLLLQSVAIDLGL